MRSRGPSSARPPGAEAAARTPSTYEGPGAPASAAVATVHTGRRRTRPSPRRWASPGVAPGFSPERPLQAQGAQAEALSAIAPPAWPPTCAPAQGDCIWPHVRLRAADGCSVFCSTRARTTGDAAVICRAAGLYRPWHATDGTDAMVCCPATCLFASFAPFRAFAVQTSPERPDAVALATSLFASFRVVSCYRDPDVFRVASRSRDPDLSGAWSTAAHFPSPCH